MARSLHSKRLHRNKKAMRQKYAKKELTKLVKTVSSGDAKPIDVLKKNIEENVKQMTQQEVMAESDKKQKVTASTIIEPEDLKDENGKYRPWVTKKMIHKMEHAISMGEEGI